MRALDYFTDYTEIHGNEREVPQECPVCGLPGLVPSGYDSYLEEIAWGICAACSYTKEFEVADLEGRDEELDGRLADPNS